MASHNPKRPTAVEPCAFPPTQDQLQAAFESAFSTIEHPHFILEQSTNILAVFEAMIEEALAGMQEPLTSRSSAHSPPIQSFFSNLMKWSECSLQTALERLRQMQSGPLQLESASPPTWLPKFDDLQTQFKFFQTTLQRHIISPSATQRPNSQMDPLIRHFIEILFADTTALSTSEIKETWTRFLKKIKARCKTELSSQALEILPCCFLICYCTPQEDSSQLRQVVVGTSAEKWLRVKIPKVPSTFPVEAQGNWQKAARAVNNMIKDVRFHWVLDTYHRQHNGSMSRAECRKHIIKIRAQGDLQKDMNLVPSGGPDNEIHSAIDVATEGIEPQICSDFPTHQAYIVDVKTGGPKPRCAKCRVRFIRDFVKDQLELECRQGQGRPFPGISCAEDIGVILCRK